MMKKLIIAALVLIAFEGQAQKKVSGFLGSYNIGAYKLSVAPLNNSLSQYNYPAFSEFHMVTGGGGFAIIKNIIIGGEGYDIPKETIETDSLKFSLESSYGMFNIGYVVLSSEKFILYPLLGLGGGESMLFIREKFTSTPSFGSLMTNPYRGATLSTGGFLSSISLNTGYKIGKIFVLGLNAGYNFVPSKGNWEIDGTKVAGGPEFGLDGFFGMLKISFGTFSIKQ